MNNLHIHEVLRMMLETRKTYSDSTEFTNDLTAKFGSDVRFFACSSKDINVESAYDFLLKKGKIVIDENSRIALSPDMTMCDEHNHDHDHHH